jgi:hypothetical protein
MENISGWASEMMNPEEGIREMKQWCVEGDMLAVYTLIEIGFVTGKYGGHLEKNGPPQNELLGFPERTLDEIVRSGL